MTNCGVRGIAAGVPVPDTLRVLVAEILRGGGGVDGGGAGGVPAGVEPGWAAGSGWALGSGWVTERFLAGGCQVMVAPQGAGERGAECLPMPQVDRDMPES